VDYRGVFSTDADGLFLCAPSSRAILYPDWDGPVGNMVKAQSRHGMRPAHIHFLVGASGYRELVTALYLRDDRTLPTMSCSARRTISRSISWRTIRTVPSRACEHPL